MIWQVFSQPEAANDVMEIADWYDTRAEGLGDRFIEEFLDILHALSQNPLLHSKRHPRKNIRWRYTKSFPYRIVYEVIDREKTVIVAAVLHGARHDREWKRRV